MKIISIGVYDQDFPIALVKCHKSLDDDFAKEVRAITTWGTISDEELLAAQTFYAWAKEHAPFSATSIKSYLENDAGYAWEGPYDVLVVEL